MNAINSKMVTTGVFFLFILLTGFWLSRTGKPYSMLIQTVHKLIGVGAGVFLIVTVVRAHKAVPLTLLESGLILLTVLLFVGLVATGSFLLAEREMPTFVSILHKAFPYLTVLSTAGMLYLLLNRPI